MASKRTLLCQIADAASDFSPGMQMGEILALVVLLLEEMYRRPLENVNDREFERVVERFRKNLKRQDERSASPLRKKIRRLLGQLFPAPTRSSCGLMIESSEP